VGWVALGSGIPFALAALYFAIRIVSRKAPDRRTVTPGSHLTPAASETGSNLSIQVVGDA
jgi:hypothetical protein